MATIESNAFEIERRSIQLKYNTNMPGGGTLGYDGNPNSVTNGATSGQTLIYNVAQGATFMQSNGAWWFKKSLPNTWIQLGGATNVASNVVTYTIPAGNTQQFYSLNLTNNKSFEWVVDTTAAAGNGLSKLSSLYTNSAVTFNEYSFLGENVDMDINITASGTNCLFAITNNEATAITCSVKVEALNEL